MFSSSLIKYHPYRFCRISNFTGNVECRNETGTCFPETITGFEYDNRCHSRIFSSKK